VDQVAFLAKWLPGLGSKRFIIRIPTAYALIERFRGQFSEEFYARVRSGSARRSIVVKDERDIAFQEFSAMIFR
jgi:hypothetical protein